MRTRTRREEKSSSCYCYSLHCPLHFGALVWFPDSTRLSSANDPFAAGFEAASSPELPRGAALDIQDGLAEDRKPASAHPLCTDSFRPLPWPLVMIGALVSRVEDHYLRMLTSTTYRGPVVLVCSPAPFCLRRRQKEVRRDNGSRSVHRGGTRGSIEGKCGLRGICAAILSGCVRLADAVDDGIRRGMPTPLALGSVAPQILRRESCAVDQDRGFSLLLRSARAAFDLNNGRPQLPVPLSAGGDMFSFGPSEPPYSLSAAAVTGRTAIIGGLARCVELERFPPRLCKAASAVVAADEKTGRATTVPEEQGLSLSWLLLMVWAQRLQNYARVALLQQQ
ncbi:hypothetical protein MRX96_012262 [Rhipicephalus microplus]